MEVTLSVEDFKDKNEGYQKKLEEDERKKMYDIFVQQPVRRPRFGFRGRGRGNFRGRRGGFRARGRGFRPRGRGFRPWGRGFRPRFRGNRGGNRK